VIVTVVIILNNNNNNNNNNKLTYSYTKRGKAVASEALAADSVHVNAVHNTKLGVNKLVWKVVSEERVAISLRVFKTRMIVYRAVLKYMNFCFSCPNQNI